MKNLSILFERWPIFFWTVILGVAITNGIGFNLPVLMILVLLGVGLWVFWKSPLMKAFGFITFLLSLYVSLAFVSDLFTIKEFGLKPLWFILAGGLVVALAFWSSFKMVDINNESE
ncbi:MAG: hypothetical protein R2879_19925 [Saprospiraceae bacterium]